MFVKFPKLLNELASLEKLFPISFAKLLNEFVSKEELFPVSFESIFSILFCIFPIIPLRALMGTFDSTYGMWREASVVFVSKTNIPCIF